MSPFFVIVPKHGRAFTAETSDAATSLLGCSVLVELQYSVILSGRNEGKVQTVISCVP
jgi:hypothetical protein